MTFVLPSDKLQKKAERIPAKVEKDCQAKAINEKYEQNTTRKQANPHTSSIADAMEMIREKQKQMKEESNSKLELYKQMAKQEAEALAQKLPELDEVESSNSEAEDEVEPVD